MEPARREAFLRAILEELRRHGYLEMSATRAAASVGVSSEEVASEFRNIDEFTFSAYDLLLEQTLQGAATGCAGTETWPKRLRMGLERILHELAAQPEVARAMFYTHPEIAPRAYERYLTLLSRFIPFLREGRQYPGACRDLPPEVEQFALRAAKAIIFRQVGLDRIETLPGMLPEILFSILVHFLGPERAVEEMHAALADRLC